MTINEIQDQIIEEFNQFDDWMDRYGLIIDEGNTLKKLDEQYKIPQNLIEGCQSRVWFHVDMVDGKMQIEGESDAVIVKGIVALLIKVLNNQTPQDIFEADLYFVDEIGLKEHLSPTRSNGLLAMLKQIKMYALVYKTKMETNL